MKRQNEHSFNVRGYDRLASFYQPIERCVFGDRLQQARTALLDQLPQWDRMLVLGDGDGRLLHAIVHSVTQSQPSSASRTIVSLDQSSKMLDRQRERLAGHGTNVSIEFIQTDALEYQPPADSFDVIVTPFFLDCFNEAELRKAMRVWVAGLTVGGVWYHVDFVLPDRGWRRFRAKLLLHAMHLFFRVTTGLRNRTLVDVQAIFENLNMHPIAKLDGDRSMITTTIYQGQCLQAQSTRVSLP
ncbi:class I SAM-dependent methyltransferase [Neorhodopirellula pilleata]|uniref:Methyltransferase domain protein n=1 Tax=Neorhodopirellula pilleata TaxID=2714738 RepID=A0A5C6A0X7_9BACT|nr:class I SAM-dependent methyltransferase [Neorhodopirellula pilleata]TWT92977.1 Methyltransferase domain protein [Neorhodopirellula pilleata]